MRIPRRIDKAVLEAHLGKKRFEDLMIALYGPKLLVRREPRIRVTKEALKEMVQAIEGHLDPKRTGLLMKAPLRAFFQDPKAKRMFLEFAARLLPTLGGEGEEVSVDSASGLPSEKLCPKCGQTKPVSLDPKQSGFYIGKGYKGRLVTTGRCKECHNQYRQAKFAEMAQ